VRLVTRELDFTCFGTETSNRFSVKTGITINI